LLGAWATIKDVQKVLDIGTGTGLIALMLAQRVGKSGSVVGIEPEPDAFELVTQNIKTSPFSRQVAIQNLSLQKFNTNSLFDLLICNPPFFENSLKPPNKQRENERHSDSLPFQDLISHSKKLLHPSGRLVVILPVTEGNRLIKLAQDAGFDLVRQCAVFSKETKPQERWLLDFSLEPIENTVSSKLTIMKANGDWTEEYVALTRDFYLKF
jgi:tRNA1Val (adenine37-N6)-methyltransferase